MASHSQSKVYFFFDGTRVSLSNRTDLKKFIENLFRREGESLACLNYIFVPDKRLLAINRDYLGHDYYTDIITFDLSETQGAVKGEVYISVDRVRENARSLGISFRSELHRVIFHGALHLCGYRDKSRSEKKSMVKAEDYYLSLYL